MFCISYWSDLKLFTQNVFKASNKRVWLVAVCARVSEWHMFADISKPSYLTVHHFFVNDINRYLCKCILYCLLPSILLRLSFCFCKSYFLIKESGSFDYQVDLRRFFCFFRNVWIKFILFKIITRYHWVIVMKGKILVILKWNEEVKWEVRVLIFLYL